MSRSEQIWLHTPMDELMTKLKNDRAAGEESLNRLIEDVRSKTEEQLDLEQITRHQILTSRIIKNSNRNIKKVPKIEG